MAAQPLRPLARLLPATLHDREHRVYRVREATPADRAALERFYDAYEPKRAAQGLPPVGAARIARWLDGILDAGAHLLVETGGELVGHAFVVPTERAGVWEYAIFLDHGIRGRGLGTAVNRLAAEAAAELGLQRLWLSVEPHNRAAIRSYERTGFRFRPETIYSSEAEMELVLPPEVPPRPV